MADEDTTGGRPHLSSMRDVARRAEVSVGTVSMVLNDDPRVSAASRERVLTAVRELGYVPSPIGKAINRKNCGVVGVLVPVSVSYPFDQLVRGVNKVAEEHGRGVFVSYSQDRPDLEARALSIFAHLRLDGIILAATPGCAEHNLPLLEAIASRGVPVVQVERQVAGLVAPYVGSANVESAAEATRRLLERWGGPALCVTGPLDYSVRAARLAGFHGACDAAGLSAEQRSVVELPLLPPQELRPRIAELLAGRRGSVLWLAHYMDALVDGLADAGLRNGRDLGLTVFDVQPYEAQLSDEIECWRQDGLALGRRAAQVLLGDSAAEADDGALAFLPPVRLMSLEVPL
mgnify:CR=1 FL=1